jgi:hypothetical protein
MTCIAKIFWPDHLEIVRAPSFEELGTIIGKHLEIHFRMSPLKIEFSVESRR